MLQKIVQFFKNKIFSVTISCVLVIAEIFAGIYIADVIDFNTNKKVEQIKLKSKVVEYRIDYATEILSLIQEPATSVWTDDSILAQSIDGLQGSDHMCSTILKDVDSYLEWTKKFHKVTSRNKFLFTKEINTHIEEIYLYDQVLNEMLPTIPKEDFWEVGVVLYSDIVYMYGELSQLLQEYLNEAVYELDNDNIIDTYSRNIELSGDKFNLIKYGANINSYYEYKFNN